MMRISINGRAGDLRQAAALVKGVLNTLNIQTHECGTCGLNKAENWAEALVAKELAAVVSKLERHADDFQRQFNTDRKGNAT